MSKKYDTTTKITDVDIDGKQIKSACMTTISKDAGDKEPSDSGKQKLLLCEHSPIRRGEISGKGDNIPYAISTHFCRHHIGVEKGVGTERTDRTGIEREERSQMNYVPMEMEANLQALINISRKRMCTCADPTTRDYGFSVWIQLTQIDPNVAWAMVPECVYRGGCPEYKPCGFYEAFAKKLTKEELMDVHTRYDAYNNLREKQLKSKK